MITGELPVEINWLTEAPDADSFPQVLPSDLGSAITAPARAGTSRASTSGQ